MVAVVTNPPAITVPRTNPAIVPVARTGGATNRQAQVLQRAKDNPGPCDIAFIGDSITQGWEGNGKNVWTNYYGNRKCLNFGVGGDKTEHVLWRFENGQLDGIKPKAAVLMIGTNNSNKNRAGVEDYSEAEILEGIQAIISQILLGLSHDRCVQVQADRARAIADTLAAADARDVVLVAGKGHEDYQEVAGVKHPFSDLAHARAALAARRASA